MNVIDTYTSNSFLKRWDYNMMNTATIIEKASWLQPIFLEAKVRRK
jgi:hypothetical protein